MTLNWNDAKRAIEILELSMDGEFGVDDVKRRYRQLHSRVHPDKGGSNYFAKQLNEARDILIKWIKAGKPGVPSNSSKDSNTETEKARRQREEWERSQRTKQQKNKGNSNNTNETKVIPWWHSRSFKVALRFWADGVLRVGMLSLIIGLGYVALKTDFGKYSPLSDSRAERVVICWPIHSFDGQGRYTDYQGDVSYVNREKLPPELWEYYDKKNDEIEKMISEKDGKIQEIVKWGGFPMISVYTEEQRKHEKPLIEIQGVENIEKQACRKWIHETQYVSIE